MSYLDQLIDMVDAEIERQDAVSVDDVLDALVGIGMPNPLTAR